MSNPAARGLTTHEQGIDPDPDPDPDIDTDPDTDPSPTASREPRATPRPAAGFTVLYDADCPVCRRARAWADGQDQLVPLRFLPAGGPEARRRFPDLDHASTLVDITTVGDDGAIRRGKSAWITVLWAIARTRTLANDVAAGRKLRTFGTVVGGTEVLRRAFRSGEAIACTTEACETVPASAGRLQPPAAACLPPAGARVPPAGGWLPPAGARVPPAGARLPPDLRPDATDGRVRTADRDEL